MIFPPIQASKLKAMATLARGGIIDEILMETQKQIVDAAKKGYYETTREFPVMANGKVTELVKVAIEELHSLFPGIECIPGLSERDGYVIYTFSWEAA